MMATPGTARSYTRYTDKAGWRYVRAGSRRFLGIQVAFDERSQQALNPLWSAYMNTEPSPFFEAAVIRTLLRAGLPAEADYVGVLSWKFAEKIPIRPADLFSRLAIGPEADVYSFFGSVRSQAIWPLAEARHPGITRTAALVLRRVGLDVDPHRLRGHVIYQNHFFARRSLYEQFGRDLLLPALDAMADPDDGLLQALLRQDSRYRDPSVPEARLVAMFGVPYYCLHPFIAERLFSTWLALHPEVRVRHVWRGRYERRT